MKLSNSSDTYSDKWKESTNALQTNKIFRGEILSQKTYPIENINISVTDDWFSYPSPLQKKIDDWVKADWFVFS